MIIHEPTVDLSAVVDFDTDGALQETADAAARHSRRALPAQLGRSPLGGAAVAGGLLPGARAVAATSKGDVAILNFALTLEYLESRVLRVGAQARRSDRRARALRAGSCTSTRWRTSPR